MYNRLGRIESLRRAGQPVVQKHCIFLDFVRLGRKIYTIDKKYNLKFVGLFVKFLV
jgi:hypothetical protein